MEAKAAWTQPTVKVFTPEGVAAEIEADAAAAAAVKVAPQVAMFSDEKALVAAFAKKRQQMDALSALDPHHNLLRASSQLRTEASRRFIAGTLGSADPKRKSAQRDDRPAYYDPTHLGVMLDGIAHAAEQQAAAAAAAATSAAAGDESHAFTPSMSTVASCAVRSGSQSARFHQGGTSRHPSTPHHPAVATASRTPHSAREQRTVGGPTSVAAANTATLQRKPTARTPGAAAVVITSPQGRAAGLGPAASAAPSAFATPRPTTASSAGRPSTGGSSTSGADLGRADRADRASGGAGAGGDGIGAGLFIDPALFGGGDKGGARLVSDPPLIDAAALRQKRLLPSQRHKAAKFAAASQFTTPAGGAATTATAAAASALSSRPTTVSAAASGSGRVLTLRTPVSDASASTAHDAATAGHNEGDLAAVPSAPLAAAAGPPPQPQPPPPPPPPPKGEQADAAAAARLKARDRRLLLAREAAKESGATAASAAVAANKAAMRQVLDPSYGSSASGGGSGSADDGKAAAAVADGAMSDAGGDAESVPTSPMAAGGGVAVDTHERPQSAPPLRVGGTGGAVRSFFPKMSGLRLEDLTKLASMPVPLDMRLTPAFPPPPPCLLIPTDPGQMSADPSLATEIRRQLAIESLSLSDVLEAALPSALPPPPGDAYTAHLPSPAQLMAADLLALPPDPPPTPGAPEGDTMDLEVDEEVTYDYKFPVEAAKIACHCGSPRCLGVMN